MRPHPLVLVHGGAGPWPDVKPERREAIRVALFEACRAGVAAIEGGALDAAVAAVVSLEASGQFNAGAASALTREGTLEMDAAVMRGDDLGCGAVAAVSAVRHPVLLARAVLERTEHVIMAGAGAERLAVEAGLTTEPFPIDERRRAKLERLLSERSAEAGEAPVARERTGDTVGAVAFDADGRTAAAVSTGGIWLKRVGRIGDSPVPGAGLLADDVAGGAVVATGRGEVILKLGVSRTVLEHVAAGEGAHSASRRAVETATERLGDGTVGVITVDRHGRIGTAFNTGGMPRAVLRLGEEEPAWALLAGDHFPIA